MSSHYVYVIVNKINLKLYFGSHSWDGEGLDKNYYGSGKIIKQAIKKYGKDNFIVYPIKFYDNVDECRKAEEELLKKYDISNNQYCYNIKNSAIGWDKGLKHSEDTKRKISESIKGEKHPLYGKHLSEDTKRKLSRANKGKKLSDETRKKLSQANKGKTLSEKTRRKIAQSLKGLKHSDEFRKKMSQVQNYRKTPIVAIQKDTGKIRVFESQAECCRVLGINSRKIYDCLKGRRKTCKGYIIKCLKRCSTDYKITKRKAKETEKIKLTTKIKGKTPIVAIQKDTGRVRMFLSQRECSRVLGVNLGNVNKCLKGRRNHTGGYTFKYVEQLESGIYEGML